MPVSETVPSNGNEFQAPRSVGGPGLRMQRVQTPVIPVVAELIRDNPGTISLGQGVVHFPPPPQTAVMVQEFLANPDLNKYQHVQGIPGLIEIVSQKLRAENQLDLSGRAVVITAGSNMAFLNLVIAIADADDEFILLSPFYFNQEMAVTMAGCKAVLVSTDADYQINLNAIEQAISSRTRAVVTISPNNPTGAVYSEQSLRDVNALCAKHGIYHISDEAYEYFTYDDARHFSPGAIIGSEQHTVSLYSLSKAYGFASWRIGYMVVPVGLLDAIKKVQDTNVICAPVVSQMAAIGALQAGRPYFDRFLPELSQTRALVLGALGSLKGRIHVPAATGAFYFLVEVDCQITDLELVRHLVEEYKVAVIPGSAFGVDESCSVRIAYGALDKHTVTVGMDRLIRGLSRMTARA